MSRKNKPKKQAKQGKHYKELNLTEDREIEESDGLFTFPNQVVGLSKNGQGNYLVFYFYDKESYEMVRKFFDTGKKSKTHPFLDTKKLTRMVKERIEDE